MIPLLPLLIRCTVFGSPTGVFGGVVYVVPAPGYEIHWGLVYPGLLGDKPLHP